MIWFIVNYTHQNTINLMKPTKSIYILLSLFLMFSCGDNFVEPLVCDEGLTDVDGVCTLVCDEGLTEVEGECLDECGEVNGDNSTCLGCDMFQIVDL